jgi:hypothetical protein
VPGHEIAGTGRCRGRQRHLMGSWSASRRRLAWRPLLRMRAMPAR